MSGGARTIARAVAAIVAMAATPMCVAFVVTPAISRADACIASGDGSALAIEGPPCADVLAQEARWLTAITAGDVGVVESILSPTFRHVNADGEMFDRGQEIASVEPLPVAFTASEQIIDIAGDTAVVHGVNTVTRDGKVIDRERFTDVFVLQGGVWLALSAQETRL